MAGTCSGRESIYTDSDRPAPDGVPEDRHLVTEINGKPTAQIMFYNGLSHTINSGDLSYLPNPYIQDNLAFSFQLEYQAALYYPELYRGIYLAGLRYNLHLRPRAAFGGRGSDKYCPGGKKCNGSFCGYPEPGAAGGKLKK